MQQRSTDRPIPACAGKPRRCARTASSREADPRVCGEAYSVKGRNVADPGRSPRVRGSRGEHPPFANSARPIPACAGKPARRRGEIVTNRADPRVCGEASSAMMSRMCRVGRSPRVRGSLYIVGGPRGQSGPIPACAGKPWPVSSKIGSPWADPRVCGEADAVGDARAVVAGRSPRVRGSQRVAEALAVAVGPIPACAGKPRGCTGSGPRSPADPRVCGEALLSPSRIDLSPGRSPRVRGSRVARPKGLGRQGPIPACAGKPGSMRGRAA